MSPAMREVIFNLAMQSIRRGELKGKFMKEMETIYDEAKWLTDGI